MVVSAKYIPERGDVVLINTESQAGRMPVVVITPLQYNRKVGRAICCPITNKIKKYPFEVVIPNDVKMKGVVLSDQVKSLDWKAKKAEPICALPDEVIKEILAKARALL